MKNGPTVRNFLLWGSSIVLLLFVHPVTISVHAYVPGQPLMCPDGSSPKIPKSDQAPSAPKPFCPMGAVNTVDFVTPCADVMDPNTTPCTIDAFAEELGRPPIGVPNKVYGIVGKDGKKYVVQESGSKHLLYRIDGNRIAFLQDTTWAAAKSCSVDVKAFQRIYEAPNSLGATWVRKSVSCEDGESTLTGGNVALPYDSSQEHPLRENPPLSSFCSAKDAAYPDPSKVDPTRAFVTNKLIYHGPAKCGTTPGEAMVIYNKPGSAGEEEVFVYFYKKGLTSWKQRIDWTNKIAQPENWTKDTDLCAGFPKPEPFCEVQCVNNDRKGNPVNYNNVPLKLTAQQAIKRALLLGKEGQNVNFGVQKIVPAEEKEKPHTAPAYPYAWMQDVNRAYTPGSFAYKSQRLNEEKADKTTIAYNSIQAPGTSRFAMTKEKDAKTPQDTGIATSINDLHNMVDHVPTKFFLDNSKVFGALTLPKSLPSNPSLGVNRGNNEINMDRPQEKLAEKIIPPHDSVNADSIATAKTAAIGENDFKVGTSNNDLLSLPRQITADIISQIVAEILNFVGGKEKALETLKNIGVETELYSCTHITGEQELLNRWQDDTDAQFPAAVRKTQIETLKRDGKKELPYNNPLTDSGNKSVDIDTAFYGSNENQQRMCKLVQSKLPSALIPKYLPALAGCKVPESQNTVPTNPSQCSTDFPEAKTGVDIQTAIEQAAQSVGIPACVLEGIATIEDGYTWKANDTARIQACSRNSCGAAGPFQLSTGKDNTCSTNCTSCGAGYCPKDAVLFENNDPSTGKYAVNPCDFVEAGKVAAITIQSKAKYWAKEPITSPNSQSAIILGGDSYFGSSQKLTTQRRGKNGPVSINGCSYGEFIYQLCNPSYTCGSSSIRLP